MTTENSKINIKGKSKIIDTISYKGKCIDISILKRRIISAIALLGAIAFAGILIFL
ncbi:MAG: hypothetical protein J6O61_13450 [Butyrivibrio sp.]|uniref:hypothetical protein n=1 Tax=Butyrivibrio sp. TaxID=28121 RepID=UPI001B2D2805|nr:hypothetical protein [Butyrivibrio sp.]MBO6241826.1 hypothetical protein [Butyrivibrio sp.]